MKEILLSYSSTGVTRVVFVDDAWSSLRYVSYYLVETLEALTILLSVQAAILPVLCTFP